MTDGQRLYEHKHPKFITVYASRSPWAEPMVIPNPVHQVDWKFLTERCKQTWEESARGHHIFSPQGA